MLPQAASSLSCWHEVPVFEHTRQALSQAAVQHSFDPLAAVRQAPSPQSDVLLQACPAPWRQPPSVTSQPSAPHSCCVAHCPPVQR
jgi:hypothetical protein